HIHIGKYTSSFVNSSYEENQNDVAKSLNFKKIIFIHNSFFTDPDLGIKNTLDFLSNNPDFAYAYIVYNPHYIEKSLSLIDEYFSSSNTAADLLKLENAPGKNSSPEKISADILNNKNSVKSRILGIKIHPEDHQVAITDKRYEKLWEAAVKKDIPVLSHTWNPNVASKSQKYADALLFEEVLSRHPDLKIILGHAGAKDYYYFKVIDLMKKNNGKNLFVDIAGDIFYRGMLELFVRELGSTKILFGTDSPWADPLLTVLYVLDSKISVEDKENIFYNNAAALFNI
ncbi:MAG TPA: amidohydrolase family protein, partial [Candidatus Humimicrobiaceae bacterium]